MFPIRESLYRVSLFKIVVSVFNVEMPVEILLSSVQDWNPKYIVFEF
jgi:hypothetical protein